MNLDRRSFITALAISGVLPESASASLFDVVHNNAPGTTKQLIKLTVDDIKAAEQLAGLSFTAQDRELMLDDINEALESYAQLRTQELPNALVPALQLNLDLSGTRPSASGPTTKPAWIPPETALPASDEEIAFLPVTRLAALLRSGAITSSRLTRLYLDRLQTYDPVLQAVVSLTEERAMEQAARADAELAAGRWRGPLHGIPWGAKDLLAVSGYPTTWGAMPYKDQRFDLDATVVKKLDEAGAVLVAKLTLGALAWGDVWYGGKTKNPWNIEEGSSGSSAGPGSAVAAGLVGFAIGSETLGSIVSPSTRNATSGLRPTYGRVSRHGAMALSWSMDKLGPMCRSAEDCALVFQAIHGEDPQDVSTRDADFDWDGEVDLSSLRVGFLEEAFEQDYANKEADHQSLAVLRGLGIRMTPVTWPDVPLEPILLSLQVEAAAAFDQLTRERGVDQMVRQERRAWPNVFRAARFVPAVEYINGNRLRTRLMQQTEARFNDVDVIVAPSFGGGTLQITNLTGHPAVVIPNRLDPLPEDPDSDRRSTGSISFISGLYRDDLALRLAAAYQKETDFHRQKPPIQ